MSGYRVEFVNDSHILFLEASCMADAIANAIILKTANSRLEFQHILADHFKKLAQSKVTFDAMFLEAWKIGYQIHSVTQPSSCAEELESLEIKPSRHHVRVSLKEYIDVIELARKKKIVSDSELLDWLLGFVKKEANLEDTLKVICDNCKGELTYTLVVEQDQIHAMAELCVCCFEST